MAVRILLSGICGHMGAEVATLAQSGKYPVELSYGVDVAGGSAFGLEVATSFDAVNGKADCIVDFSHHSNTQALLDYAVATSTPVVLATTGQTQAELDLIRQASAKVPVFFAANYSIGVTLLINLAKNVAKALPNAEIEIIETHHDRKLDAPSGTALAIANAIKTVRPQATYNLGRSGMCKRTPDEIGINSIRLGNCPGTHEVLVGTNNETITLKHEAHNRTIFAEGALAAVSFLVGKPAGLYDMNSMIQF